MKNKPFPEHSGPFVNVVEEFIETKMIKEVEKVKTPMLMIHEKLTEARIIQKVHGFCEIYLPSPNKCEELKKCFQELINQGTIQLGRTFKK